MGNNNYDVIIAVSLHTFSDIFFIKGTGILFSFFDKLVKGIQKRILKAGTNQNQSQCNKYCWNTALDDFRRFFVNESVVEYS